MGVVTVSGSAPQAPLSVKSRFTSHSSPLRNPVILAFKSDQQLYPKTKKSASVTEPEPLSTDLVKKQQECPRRSTKPASKRVKAVSSHGAPALTVDLDYNQAAAALENIYKLSPAHFPGEGSGRTRRRSRLKTKKQANAEAEEETQKDNAGEVGRVVRNRRRKSKRLSLEKRVSLRKEVMGSSRKRGKEEEEEKKEEIGCDDVDKLVREYSISTDLVTLDWKKMKIPPVLPSSEHAWLFTLMQSMKALVKVMENLHKDLDREPTDGEVAAATNMSSLEVRRHMVVGRAARNKLIKHNLRLVLFVINKYYQELATGHRFQDLCQAGAKGLITSISRFEPKRGFRLSTYALFWIRHAIIRSITLSSFTRVPFGIESVRLEIQRAKLELLFELERMPTEEEISAKVGISPKRYNDIMKASKTVYSLHARHLTTQEEFINGITDIDGVGSDNRRQPTLLRLALDDVLDSLKPKESLVIRQRYGLDGKGDRTLGEIAGNLNISREMVRKHEVKALMKLKHPARVDYLRRYIV